MDWVGIAGLIAALEGITLAILIPLMNARIKRKEAEMERRFAWQDKEHAQKLAKGNRRERHVVSQIYSYLWNLLISSEAERVCIVQPHPKDNLQFISISFEVTLQGVSPQMEYFQNHKMSEWAELIDMWKKNDYLFFTRDEMIAVKKLFPEAHRRGCSEAVFCRLLDGNDYWIGTLVIDYTKDDPPPVNTIYYRDELKKIAILIADILPDYNPPE